MGEFVFKMNEPKDYEYLLLCDGSTISEENYPELVAVLGGTQLPNLVGRFLQGSATAGTYKEAGLPNIEGSIGNGNGFYTYASSGGAFSLAGGTQNKNNTTESLTLPTLNYSNFSFNASRVSSIYGNSDTVQPPAYTAKIYICFAG